VTALEALALARTEGISVRLAAEGAHIRYRSRGKAPAHVLKALRAAKPEIVALQRWRVLYARREREHVGSFRDQLADGHYDGLRSASRTPKRSSREAGRGEANPHE
jgi:hypothetical protein